VRCGSVSVSVRLGRFLRLERRKRDYAAVFENGEIVVPREAVVYAAYFYAFVFRRGALLAGRPGEEELALTEKEDGWYLRVRHRGEDIYLGPLSCDREFAEVFNRSHKVILFYEDPLEEGSFTILSAYGSEERRAFEELEKAVVHDMVKWINREGEVGFLLEIAHADPDEAEKIAKRYRRRLLKRRRRR
jgi:hypothetical protein